MSMPAVLAALAGIAIGLSPVWDYDVWFQLHSGQAILALRHLPATDLFSFTATDHPWDTQEWLSQVLMALVHAAGGLHGLTIAKALLCGAMAWLVHRRAAAGRSTGDGWAALALAAAAAAVMRWHLVERPQVITFTFLALELLMLEQGAPLWRLVPLSALWANLHGGSALLGPGVLAVWTAGRALAAGRRHAGWAPPVRDAVLPGLAMAAAIMLNPAGWRLFTYPFETMGDRFYMLNVREWLPPTFAEQPEFFIAAAVAWALALAAAAESGWPSLLTAAVLTGLAFSARRHIPLAAIALVPPAVHGLVRLLPAGRGWPAAGLLAATLAVAWPAARGEALRLGFHTEWYPVGAPTVLRDCPAGTLPIRVYTLHRWGGYLSWALPERVRIFIDGRQLVFGPELFADYYRMLEDRPEAPDLLARWVPDAFVLEYGSRLGARLAADPGVALVHWDDTAMVYVRRSAVPGRWLAAHAYRNFHPELGTLTTPQAALADLDRVAAAAPGAARPRAAAARVLATQGRLDPAWREAQAAVERAPRIAPVLLTAFDLALTRGDLAAAADLADRARRAEPAAPMVWVALARLAGARHDPAAAASAVRRAIRTGEDRRRTTRRPEPALADAYRMRAETRQAAGDSTGAAEDWRQAGNALVGAGQPAQALEAYRAAAALAPPDARLHHNAGLALSALGRDADALAALRQAAALDPGSAEILVTLGVVAYRTGGVDEARSAWRRALAVDPKQPDAPRYLEAADAGLPIEPIR